MTDQPTTEPTEAHDPGAPDAQAVPDETIPAEPDNKGTPDERITDLEHRVADLEVIARAGGYTARLKAARAQGVDVGGALTDMTPDAPPPYIPDATQLPGAPAAAPPPPPAASPELARQDQQVAHPEQPVVDEPAAVDPQVYHPDQQVPAPPAPPEQPAALDPEQAAQDAATAARRAELQAELDALGG